MGDLECQDLWPASRVARRGEFKRRVARGAEDPEARKERSVMSSSGSGSGLGLGRAKAKAKARSRTAGGHRDGGSMFSAVALLQKRREAEALLSADDRARKCAGAAHG